MGIEVASSFTRKAGIPLDDSAQVADITARNAIASGVRWIGMSVHCLADGKNYQLVGGITNSDWKEFAGAGGGGVTNIVTKTGSATILDTEDTVLCTPAASMTLTLPVGTLKEIHRFIRTDNVEDRTVTIQCAGSDKFLNTEGNTQTSMTLPYQGTCLEIIFVATNLWWAKYI